MNYMIFAIICSHSILIPAVLALFRMKKVLKDFYPFIILLWLGLLNETISLAFLYTRQANAVNSNIFTLVEFLLILYQFYRWDLLRPLDCLVLAVVLTGVWSADNFWLNSITDNNSLFRFVYSMTILFLCLGQIARIMILQDLWFKGNAVFLICITFIFFYAFKAWVESFNMLHLGLSETFRSKLWLTLNLVDLITNLSLTVAVIWMPTKQRFFIL
ncbi:MAG: hypothetical protein ACTHJN_12160 [Ginsengibacter sp.]